MSLFPRPLDHLVLPVVDLATARLRLSVLGFTVAAEARHPFGTANACVYFADSSYLEPLAIAHQAVYDDNVRKGAVFVQRDQAFRFRSGDNGLSAIVLKSGDAAGDHAEFEDAGYGVGDLFSFSRPFRQSDGSETIAGFRLAFAADPRAPELFFFTCERLQPLSPDPSLTGHANGVTGISEVLLAEDGPMDFERLLQTLTHAAEIDIHPEGFTAHGPGARISVFTHGALEKRYGTQRSGAQRGLQPAGVIFDVLDLKQFGRLLKANGVPHEPAADFILVPPASGQGVAFIFREN